jgi:hypothetical protein
MVQEWNLTGIIMVCNKDYHGLGDKLRFLIEEMLFLKNQNHAYRTIAR